MINMKRRWVMLIVLMFGCLIASFVLAVTTRAHTDPRGLSEYLLGIAIGLPIGWNLGRP